MKPGDLRRFKDVQLPVTGWRDLAGRTFLVTAAAGPQEWVSFVVDGRLEEGWGYRFVEESSELIAAASDPVRPAGSVV